MGFVEDFVRLETMDYGWEVIVESFEVKGTMMNW